MERIPIETGRVVRSTQGRDDGRYFIVLSVTDDGFVLMADGLSRKLDHPKKKKLIHLKPKPVCMDDLLRLKAENRLLDSDLRKFLEGNGFGLAQQPLCKEG